MCVCVFVCVFLPQYAINDDRFTQRTIRPTKNGVEQFNEERGLTN